MLLNRAESRGDLKLALFRTLTKQILEALLRTLFGLFAHGTRLSESASDSESHVERAASMAVQTVQTSIYIYLQVSLKQILEPQQAAASAMGMGLGGEPLEEGTGQAQAAGVPVLHHGPQLAMIPHQDQPLHAAAQCQWAQALAGGRELAEGTRKDLKK